MAFHFPVTKPLYSPCTDLEEGLLPRTYRKRSASFPNTIAFSLNQNAMNTQTYILNTLKRTRNEKSHRIVLMAL